MFLSRERYAEDHAKPLRGDQPPGLMDAPWHGL
jgi:hypothetical protein